MGHLSRSHPWHGVPVGENAPDILTAYIEMTPVDTVKYELDKFTGILKVDRPQLYSSVCPAMYGMIPQTYCAEKVAEYCMDKTGRDDINGDCDPLDICVLTEKSIHHFNILMQVVPIGGFRMLDGNEADDKIIAVMKNDLAYRAVRDITDFPPAVIERLRHYFLTYKQAPTDPHPTCEITHMYNKAEAHEVIERAREDYETHYGAMAEALRRILDGETLS